ncbi:hypothetical protein Ahy_B05g077174 isoform B [Arachis hypogaea]|uniref:Uncharacterized protein n=1 Tax=Arachis hypogaea TaxID=3818 RepID=A0A444Z4I6_ARAHY|nr:hypothetical protein Ahy_B05g077174 isoform B [Arachis hypogaea]
MSWFISGLQKLSLLNLEGCLVTAACLDSLAVLKFGNASMIREGILLGIMMDKKPLPILHPFGEDILFTKHIASYFTDRTILAGRKEMEFMANFCAFEFWQHLFRGCRREEQRM